MWYSGGKFKQGKVLSQHACERWSNSNCKGYVEPFCGALGAAMATIPKLAELGCTSFWLQDGNEALINFWQAVKDGWIPPDFVGEASRKHHKEENDPHDPMTAWCGIALSFGGGWFGTYARGYGTGSNSTEGKQIQNKKSTIKKGEMLREYGVDLKCKDFLAQPIYLFNTLMYLDPPYFNPFKPNVNPNKWYDRTLAWDNDAFWQKAKGYNKTSEVYVTNFDAPDEWESIHSWGKISSNVRWAGHKETAHEQLFVLKEKANA